MSSSSSFSPSLFHFYSNLFSLSVSLCKTLTALHTWSPAPRLSILSPLSSTGSPFLAPLLIPHSISHTFSSMCFLTLILSHSAVFSSSRSNSSVSFNLSLQLEVRISSWVRTWQWLFWEWSSQLVSHPKLYCLCMSVHTKGLQGCIKLLSTCCLWPLYL